MNTNLFGESADRYYLKHNDHVVLSFDRDCSEVEYHNLSYAPYPLQQRELTDGIYAMKLYRWLSARATSLTRRNANLLYAIAGKSRTEKSSFELVLEYGGLSLHDMWWITTNPSLSFSSVNMFDNPWSTELSDIALTGVMQHVDHIASPELTAQGNWAKCYIRHNDGIYLYKADSISAEYSNLIPESTREWFISKMLQYAGVACVDYKPVEYQDVICSVTPLFTDKFTAWIPIADLLHIDKIRSQLDKLSRGKVTLMFIIDYLVGNIDRHDRNWSVIADIDNRILDLAPLYDFNFTFEEHTSNHPKISSENILKNVRVLDKIEYFVYHEINIIEIPNLVYPKHVRDLAEFVQKRLKGIRE